MPTQILYINDENIKKLKHEKNMSSLVNKLLKAHYFRTDDPYALMSLEELKVEQAKADMDFKHMKERQRLMREVKK